MTEVDRLKYDAWTRQLERMRAMQYAYNRKFFTLLLVSSVLVLAALRDGSLSSALAIPFGLVTTGFTASYFLANADFARTHARALERQINLLLGARVLMASELEAEFFYPHAARKLSGLVWGGRWTLFNWLTLHFCLAWAGVSALGLWRVWKLVPTGEAIGWGLGALAWCAANGMVLDAWFGEGEPERRMEAQLREGLGAPASDVDSR